MQKNKTIPQIFEPTVLNVTKKKRASKLEKESNKRFNVNIKRRKAEFIEIIFSKSGVCTKIENRLVQRLWQLKTVFIYLFSLFCVESI